MSIPNLKVGFIGLGNVGGKLAVTLLRNDVVLCVHDLNHDLAQDNGVPLEFSPLLVKVFKEAMHEYGPREFSPNIIRRYEEACDVKVLGVDFPADMLDDEPEAPGAEVVVAGRQDY